MKCYRLNCKQECDKYKRQYCIMRITKEQYDLLANIREKGYCRRCGKKTVSAIYENINIGLCTDCGVRNSTVKNRYA